MTDAPFRSLGQFLAWVILGTSGLLAAPPEIKVPKTVKAPPSVKTPPVVKTPPTVKPPPVVKTPTAVKIPPSVKTPPVVKTPPSVKPPLVVKTPPLVKGPPSVKTPPVVKTPPTVKPPPVVKTPPVVKGPPSVKTPPVVKTPPTVKPPPVVKTPPVVKGPPSVKTPPVVKTPPTVVKTPPSVKPPSVVKVTPSPAAPGPGRSGMLPPGRRLPPPTRSGGDSEPAVSVNAISDAPPPDTRMSIQGGNGASDSKDDRFQLARRRGIEIGGLEEAYRRQQQSEAAESEAEDPYFKNGVFDRELFARDERLVADSLNDQLGAKDLLDQARAGDSKGGPSGTAMTEDIPVAVTRGRVKDLVAVESVSQTGGLRGDEKVLVDAKADIASGRVRDPQKVQRLIQDVANEAVDAQFGKPPAVTVNELILVGDALKKQGRLREARDFYEQAKDALKNGGKNSSEFRLQVIAEVGQGRRPVSDLDRVIQPGAVGKGGQAPAAGTGSGSGGSAPAAGAQVGVDNAGVGGQLEGVKDLASQRLADAASRAAGSGGAPTGSGAGAEAPAAQVQAPAAAVSDVAVPAAGRMTEVAVTETPATTPDTTTGTDAAATESAPQGPQATVTVPEDEIVLTSPGNNADFTHTQSNNDNTTTEVSYHPDGTFSVVTTTVTRDESGNVTSRTTQTITGTYTEGSDGQVHHSPTGMTTTTESNGSTTTTGTSTTTGDSDSDGDDDDKNKSTETADSETSDAPPAETAEENDTTATSSEEGTPNPEAAERGSRGGRLAEATQGRLGGEEQRRQEQALQQRLNGNGAGGPNPESDTGSSGVLLTPEEQKAFNRFIGLKRGGGVSTPTEESNGVAVTERDLKDIAARRGSTINPAGNNGSGGSGMGFGKGGFTPGTPPPAPAPQGAQSQVGTARAATSGAAAAASSAVRGAAVEVRKVEVREQAR